MTNTPILEEERKKCRAKSGAEEDRKEVKEDGKEDKGKRYGCVD